MWGVLYLRPEELFKTANPYNVPVFIMGENPPVILKERYPITITNENGVTITL